MKEEVRRMLQEGAEHQEILDHYVEQYGVRILAIPPQEGFNRMSFLMPIVFVVFGVGVVGILLQRWHRHSSGKASRQAGIEEVGGKAVVSEEVSRRIQKELDEMD
jgi:cytochrome c-type biogenesis protein CcmH/NrfF